MAANLALQANGQAMIAYRGETPWHKQGTKVPDDCNGQEMLKEAGLDWDVIARPSGSLNDDGSFNPNPDFKELFRSDTKERISMVGTKFHIFQNSEMIEFFEGLVKGRKIQYEVAGGIGMGEKVWVLARIPDLSYAIKGDEMLSYMLIRNGHDGKMNLCVHPTSIRTVCQNTLKSASSEFIQRRKLYGKSIHAGYRIRHSVKMATAIQTVQSAYDKCLTDAEQTRQLYEVLADKPVTETEVRAYFQKMMDIQDKAEADESEKASKMAETRARNRMDKLLEVWNRPTNQTEGTKGTAFALYNSLVEYVDFDRPTRCTDDRDDSTCRFESSMFGTGDDFKSRGLLEVMNLVGV